MGGAPDRVANRMSGNDTLSVAVNLGIVLAEMRQRKKIQFALVA